MPSVPPFDAETQAMALTLHPVYCRDPLCRHIIERLYDALSDEDARMRVFTADAVQGSSKERDQQDVDSSIEPQVKGRLSRTEAIKSRDTAWSQVRELVQAGRNRVLVEAVLSLLTHHVLPVRMAIWEAIACVAPVKDLKECVKEEAAFYKAVQSALAARRREQEVGPEPGPQHLALATSHPVIKHQQCSSADHLARAPSGAVSDH